MLFYTGIEYDVFAKLVRCLQWFELSYLYGWKPTVPLEDQLLMMLMKLTMNCHDIDLAERFAISQRAVDNIVHTLVPALHEVLIERFMSQQSQPQAKCKDSIPQAFSELSSVVRGLQFSETINAIDVGLPRDKIKH